MKKHIEVKIVIISVFIWLILIMLPVNSIYAESTEKADNTDYDKLVETLKEELRNGNLSNEEDVNRALDKVENKYGVTVSDAEKDKIVKIVETADNLGIDGDKMADIVDNVYEKVDISNGLDNPEELLKDIEGEIIESASETVKEAVKETVKTSVSDYFRVFTERLKQFIERFMEVWKK